MSLFTSQSHAYQIYEVKTGHISESKNVPTPKRVIEEIESSYWITYTFDSLLVIQDSQVDGTAFFQIPGFSLEEKPGYACIPTKSEQFTLDTQCEYEISVSDEEYKEYHFNYTPGRIPIINNSETAPLPEAIEEQNTFYPTSSIEQEPTTTYRGHSILNLRVTPVRYNSKEKRIRIYNKIQILISPVKSDNEAQSDSDQRITKDDYFWNNSVTHLSQKNLIVKPTDSINIAADKHYLIITSPSFITPVNNFANAKRKKGYSIEIVSKNNWTTNLVSEAITNALYSNSNLYYVLLVGDESIIPTKVSRYAHKSNNKFFNSDFAYSCLDGDDDFVPDICLGRIPVTSISEATNVLNKIIEYEQYTFDGSSKAAFASYFQDFDRKDGIEDRGFVCNTEKAASYLSEKFDDIFRIYYALPEVNPQRWSSIYGTGENIPEYLLRPDFKWNGNKNDIINAFNSNCNLIIHRDHGDITNWSSPYFSVNDMPQLDNDKYPIVFSINCLTGKFTESNNFARTLLNLNNSGCASVIASYEISWTNRNDAFMIGMIDASWPNPGLDYLTASSKKWKKNTDTPVESIGDMFKSGISRVCEVFGDPTKDAYTANHIEEYHILGDPSLDIYFDTKHDLSKSSKITKTDTGYTVSNSEYRVNIAFYNETTGETKRYYGYSADFKCSNSDIVHISVSKHGCATYYSKASHTLEPGTDVSDSYIYSITKSGNDITIKLTDKVDNLMSTSDAVRIKLNTISINYSNNLDVVCGNYIYTVTINSKPTIAIGGQNQKDTLVISLCVGDKVIESKKVSISL